MARFEGTQTLFFFSFKFQFVISGMIAIFQEDFWLVEDIREVRLEVYKVGKEI